MELYSNTECIILHDASYAEHLRLLYKICNCFYTSTQLRLALFLTSRYMVGAVTTFKPLNALSPSCDAAFILNNDLLRHTFAQLLAGVQNLASPNFLYTLLMSFQNSSVVEQLLIDLLSLARERSAEDIL